MKIDMTKHYIINGTLLAMLCSECEDDTTQVLEEHPLKIINTSRIEIEKGIVVFLRDGTILNFPEGNKDEYQAWCKTQNGLKENDPKEGVVILGDGKDGVKDYVFETKPNCGPDFRPHCFNDWTKSPRCADCPWVKECE